MNAAPRHSGPRVWRVVRIVLILVVLAMLAFPVYWIVVSSLSTRSQFELPPQWVPIPATLNNFAQAVRHFPMGQWFLNTTVVAIGTTGLALGVSILAGLSLSRFPTVLNKGFGGFILTTQMVPATLLVVPMYMIFARTGLLDQLAGLVLADTAFAVPLATWMLKGFFDNIPEELEQAAQVDGCSRWGAFVRVTIPLAAPGIAAVATFCFLLAWGEFFFAKTLILSDTNWVLSIGLTAFQGQYTTEWSLMLAAAVLFALPPLVFFLLVQRNLAAGLTAGAVKG